MWWGVSFSFKFAPTVTGQIRRAQKWRQKHYILHWKARYNSYLLGATSFFHQLARIVENNTTMWLEQWASSRIILRSRKHSSAAYKKVRDIVVPSLSRSTRLKVLTQKVRCGFIYFRPVQIVKVGRHSIKWTLLWCYVSLLDAAKDTSLPVYNCKEFVCHPHFCLEWINAWITMEWKEFWWVFERNAIVVIHQRDFVESTKS